MGGGTHTVAITGACSFLGTELLKRLESDRRYERVFALDVRRPEPPLEKTQFRAIDLTQPTVDAELAALFRDEGVDIVVHAAFLSQPTHASTWAHELEDIGTMHLLNACSEAAIEKLVMVSTTMIYGASAENPNFLTEEHPLRGSARSRFINDKLQAELQVQRFARERDDVCVTILRFAPLLGPTVVNYFTRFFARPVAPVIMGYDPLMQFIHEEDAVEALDVALATHAPGAFNIVGKGVLPYTTILAMMGKVPLPVPRFLAYPLSKALWATQVFNAPPTFLDHLRFLCVADGAKAQRELGFKPRFSIRRTILDFLGVGATDGSPDIARVQG